MFEWMVVVEKDEAKGENRETNVDENYEIRYVDNVAEVFLFLNRNFMYRI